MNTTIEGELIYLGSAEVWVPKGDGTIFAAPNLIFHYVTVHGYLPPQEFVEAVLRPIPIDWNAAAIAEEMIQSAEGVSPP